MNSFVSELRLAWRSLLRQPGFLAIAVFTLALGVGSVSAVYSVVNGVLLQPLPYPQAERILRLNRDQPPYGGPVARPVLEDWRAATQGLLSDVGAFHQATLNLTGEGEAERLSAQRVTPEFWQVMGLAPLHGRWFGAEEERSGERVVVLAHAFWQRRFGGDAGVVGRDIVLNGEPHRVLAVAPPRFLYPGSTQVYVPTYLPLASTGRDSNYLFVIGRLAPGAAIEQVEQALAATNARLAEEYPAEHESLGVRLLVLPQLLTSGVQQPLLVLLAASGLVLLIACANLASLLLARASPRRRELSLRAALGAGRRRLLSGQLAEALLLALLGGGLGLLLAALAVPALIAQAPDLLPSHGSPGVDLTVAGVSLGLCLLTVLAFALAPALGAARVDPAATLSEDGRGGSGGRARSRLRSGLVVAEVALSLTLLAGAGLMIDSLRRLGDVDTGVRSEGVLTAAFVLPIEEGPPGEDFVDMYRRHTLAAAGRLDAILERVRALPGVEAVGVSDALPLSGTDNISSNVEIIGRAPPESRSQQPGANWRFINPDFLPAMGLRLLRGRGLDATDARPGEFPTTVLANETFVRRFLGDADPIGQQVQFLGDAKTIVGVLADVRSFGPEREPPPELYMSHANALQSQFHLAVRVGGDPLALAEPLRRALRELEPAMPVFDLRSMEAVAAQGGQLRRFNLQLMAGFSVIALGLAAIGLYGVIAYSVAQRRHEFGIRLSLGASAQRLLGMVLGQAARLVALGLALGLAGALLLGRVLSSQLYGVGAAEPAVLLAVLLLMGAVGLVACLLPALRASRVPPATALRQQ